MAGPLREQHTVRRRLASELTRIRGQAGISGRDLAQRIGISQSKVSRIEAATTTPSLPEVAAWADAVDTTPEVRDRLRSLTEAAFTEVHTWRSLLRHRPHIQDDIGGCEQAATRVRTFQPSIIPGLLQTSEYASRVFSMFEPTYTEQDLKAAVTGRMSRQRMLYEGGAFEFLITEAALRWRPGSRRLLVNQLERIVVLTTSESVSLGLIRHDIEALTAIPHGFVIYDGDTDDDSHVDVETLHAQIGVVEPGDLAIYRSQWDRLHQMAVFGEPVRSFISTLIADLRGGAG